MKPAEDYTKEGCVGTMKSNKPQIKLSPDSTEYTKVQELVYELKVHDAMLQNVITIAPDTSMSALREVLRANRISGTPVVQGDKLVGVISIEDFIKWLGDGAVDCPIKDKMTETPDVMYSNEPLIHAVSKLDKTGFGRLPVIDRNSDKLVGIITKGDIIERLLRKLEIDYHEEEIHRYRASHLFEDIIGDEVALTFRSHVVGKDFNCAGKASSGLKKTLDRLGIHPQIVRRAAIASYEAEMNLVIYTDGGTIKASVQQGKINIEVKDSGPGIPNVEKAMQPGFSTASDWVRELGFGAGMGLVNIKKCADEISLTSEVGKGTRLRFTINIDNPQHQSKTG